MTEQGVIDDILRAMNAGRISQRALAASLNVNESRVSQMLRAGSNMTLRTVERIFAAVESCARDSGSDPKGENSRSEVECEASQSGGEAASPTPTQPSSEDTPNG